MGCPVGSKSKPVFSVDETRARLKELVTQSGRSPGQLAALLKRSGSSSKGGSFEREFCKTLGVWWCGRDDVFWRTAGSGGRATGRKKQGKTTTGHEGDVAATDPIGLPLLQVFSFELKRGYTGATIHDLLDAPSDTPQTYAAFIEQAGAAAELAKAKWWALVTRRDGRRAVIWLPAPAWAALMAAGVVIPPNTPYIRTNAHNVEDRSGVVGLLWSTFTELVTPDNIRAVCDAGILGG